MDESDAAPDDFAARVERVVELLESIRDDRRQLAELDEEQRKRLLTAAGQVARPGPWARRELARAARKRRREAVRAADEAVLDSSAIRVKRAEPVFSTPVLVGRAPVSPERDIDEALGENAAPPKRVERARNCYVCKRDYHELHHHYDSLCPECGDFNFEKRSQSADLSGRVALITGARVKIGYQAAILLLRAGARVIVSTRFPRDAAARYGLEPDHAEWGDRLEIHGLDLRHTPSVEAFCQHLGGHLDRLDFILNNACQTVRRPVGWYTHLLPAERQPLAELPAFARHVLASDEEMKAEARTGLVAPGDAVHDAAGLSQVVLLDEDLDRGAHLFPDGALDADLQQVDLRGRNSWRLGLDEVSAVELLEVQLVNAVAPFILNARLKEVMLRQPSRDKHIVNVSAVEGQFYRTQKTDKHPHTNMAKAALNMMTRTSAKDYVKHGIHMNAVDTGWVTDEDPAEIAKRKTSEHGFHPPLDIVDGAARIVDPILHGFNTGEHVWGRFLKDYAPTDW